MERTEKPRTIASGLALLFKKKKLKLRKNQSRPDLLEITYQPALETVQYVSSIQKVVTTKTACGTH